MLQVSLHKSLTIAEPQVDLTRPHAISLMLALEEALARQGLRDFVLNLSKVKAVDGSGLGAIVKAATEARAAGQKFYLYRPSQIVNQTLEDLEIEGFFPLLEYEEDLLARIPD